MVCDDDLGFQAPVLFPVMESVFFGSARPHACGEKFEAQADEIPRVFLEAFFGMQENTHYGKNQKTYDYASDPKKSDVKKLYQTSAGIEKFVFCRRQIRRAVPIIDFGFSHSG